MRGLYTRTLSILHRKFDERPIYAQYFTQEVWWEAYIRSVFYSVLTANVGTAQNCTSGEETNACAI
jgi:hypothetical protein